MWPFIAGFVNEFSSCAVNYSWQVHVLQKLAAVIRHGHYRTDPSVIMEEHHGTVTDSLTFISHVHLNCWPEDVNGTTVGCRSNALSRVTECHRLDLSALLVVSVPRSIGSTAAVQSTALPHLHCPVIRTCCKVSLIIAHTNSATNNKCIGCWTEGATYVFAALTELKLVGVEFNDPLDTI